MVAAWAAIAALTARSAAASPEDLFGFGPSAVAMGGTGAAVGEGFGAVHANPALLSLAHEKSLALGWQSSFFSLHASGARAGGSLPGDAVHGTLVGAVLPIPFGGVLRDRVTLGAGFYTPTDVVVRAKILYPEALQAPLLSDRAHSVAVQLGAGFDLGRGIRVGGGFAALAALTGKVVVATNVLGQVGTTVDEQLVVAYAPIFGAAVDLGRGWRAGAAFRGELAGRFEVVIDVHDLGSLVVPPFHIGGVAQYDPTQVQLEVGRRDGDWALAAGVTYKRWSAYPGPVYATVVCETNPECLALRPDPPLFHDTLVPRVGVERTFHPRRARADLALHLRGGAFYERSPAPPQVHASNYADDDRLAATLGFGASWPAIDVDLFGQAHWLVPREHVKQADVPADNPGAPSWKSTGVVGTVGATVGVRF